MNRKGGQSTPSRRQSFPRSIKGKRKQGDNYKPKKEENMPQEINQQPRTGLLDLPEEVIRKIMFYFSEKDRVFKIGMSCRTLLAYSVYNVHEIEMPPGVEKHVLDKLKLMLSVPAFADYVRYVMLLGDQSKKLKKAAHDELPDLRYKRGTLIIYGKPANDVAILHLARNCRSIEAFVILRSNYFTNGRIRYLSKKCQAMTHLCINSHSLHDDGLKSISEYLPRLQYLNLKGCESLTNNGFVEASRKLKNLKELYIEGCIKLEDDGMKAISQNCRGIESLSISSCSELTDESVFFISACLPELKYLDISRIDMTDIALSRISQFSTQLEHLMMSRLTLERVTTDGLCKVLRHSPNLKTLDLSMCTSQVNDNVIFTIGDCCPNIESLSLYYDSALTDQSLVTLGVKCRNLVHLSIGQCFRLTEVGLLNLEVSNPSLTIYGKDDMSAIP